MTIAVAWKPQTCILSCSVERFICTHAHVPDAYLPRDVYILNEHSQSSEYEYVAVGTYTTTETKSTQWFNAYANIWQGSPSIKCYIFHEN
jgi:hypothetical protein